MTQHKKTTAWISTVFVINRFHWTVTEKGFKRDQILFLAI